MKAEHEEPDILHQHGDQPEQQPGGHGDGRVTPLRQHLLLDTDQVDHDGTENEPVQEHDCFEATVTEKCTNDPKHKVDGADSGSIGIVRSDDLEVFLSIFSSDILIIFLH